MKKLLVFLSGCILAQWAHGYPIVFVHIGAALPAYMYESIAQARLFNKNASLYLIVNEQALRQANKVMLENQGAIIIPCESLKKSKRHQDFIKRSTLNTTHLNGFWFKTTERFFYLEEFIRQYSLSDVFHLENDVMLYADLNALLPVFKTYAGIGAVFDNDTRCIPSFMYIATGTAIKKLTHYLASIAGIGLNDMQSLAQFRKKYGSAYIDYLPIIPTIFAHDTVLCNALGNRVQDQEDYCKNSESFKCIFDAAALGQYLGGTDPIAGEVGPGFINESCVFSPAHFLFIWERDTEDRKVPFMIYKDKKYKIANLHIHSKRLHNFSSLAQ